LCLHLHHCTSPALLFLLNQRLDTRNVMPEPPLWSTPGKGLPGAFALPYRPVRSDFDTWIAQASTEIEQLLRMLVRLAPAIGQCISRTVGRSDPLIASNNDQFEPAVSFGTKAETPYNRGARLPL